MSFSDAMRRICWITEARVMDCQRVSRDVPTTIWVICWSTAAAKIVLATSSPSSVCQVPPTARTSSSSSSVPALRASASPETTWMATRGP